MENVSLSTYAQYAPEIAIGLGVLLSLLLVETMGVTAGGLIVPGYIALYLHRPDMVIFTFMIALLTFAIIKILSKFTLIYGKRRIAMSLLIGFFLGYSFKVFLAPDISSDVEIVKDNGSFLNFLSIEYFRTITNDGKNAVIGHIIPGLIASWMDRQGVIRTIATLLIVSSIVLLIMIILYGGLIQYV